MARPMTDAEKKAYKAAFPKLDVDKAVVTGEVTKVYNCLAWTLGITSSWIWPGGKDTDFDTLYATHGYKRAPNGPIAAFGISKSDMKHGSVSGAGHGPRWESKAGEELRFQHGLMELESASYGTVLFFYDKSSRGISRGLVKLTRDLQKLSRLSANERRQVQAAAAGVAAGKREQFEELYREWQKERSVPELAIQSDPGYVRHLPSFIRLAGMGAEVLPLVVEKMGIEGDFFALQLYDILQEKAGLRVELHRDENLLGGEQLRAAHTVRRYLTK